MPRPRARHPPRGTRRNVAGRAAFSLHPRPPRRAVFRNARRRRCLRDMCACACARLASLVPLSLRCQRPRLPVGQGRGRRDALQTPLSCRGRAEPPRGCIKKIKHTEICSRAVRCASTFSPRSPRCAMCDVRYDGIARCAIRWDCSMRDRVWPRAALRTGTMARASGAIYTGRTAG